MNPKNPTFDPARRKFIGSCCAAVGATGMLSTLAQLRLTGAIASPGNGPVTPNTLGPVTPWRHAVGVVSVTLSIAATRPTQHPL